MNTEHTSVSKQVAGGTALILKLYLVQFTLFSNTLQDRPVLQTSQTGSPCLPPLLGGETANCWHLQVLEESIQCLLFTLFQL